MTDSESLIKTEDDQQYVASVIELIAGQLERGEIDYEEVERMLLANQSPQTKPDIGVSHSFCNGVYMREMRAPAGSLMLGHAHAEACFNIVLEGKVRVFLNSEFKEVSAPQVLITPANTRKFGYVIEDLCWINVIASESTNVEDIEKRFVIKSPTFVDWETSKTIV